MTTIHRLPGSVRQSPQLLRNVCDLPCPLLEDLAEQFVAAKQFKVMLSALTTVVELSAEDLLRRFNRHGTFLFHGPPGTGKSTLARLLPQLWAAQTGSCGKLVRVNMHSFASREHGQSQKNVNELFRELEQLAETGPVFAILDEVETIATSRDQISAETSPIDARNSVNALLEQLDDPPENCFLLATTNASHLIDKAALSRFTFLFEVPLPTPAMRLQKLHSGVKAVNPRSPFLRGVPRAVASDLASLTEGKSFRDIENLLLWCTVLHRDRSFLPSQLVATVKFLHKHSV